MTEEEKIQWHSPANPCQAIDRKQNLPSRRRRTQNLMIIWQPRNDKTQDITRPKETNNWSKVPRKYDPKQPKNVMVAKKFDSIDQLILIALSGWGAKLTCLALPRPNPALTLKAYHGTR